MSFLNRHSPANMAPPRRRDPLPANPAFSSCQTKPVADPVRRSAEETSIAPRGESRPHAHRFEIELTCDARAQLARLSETFPRFRREAWLPGGKHVGWNIEDGIRASGGPPERDRALEGVQYSGRQETRLSESPRTKEAA